MAKEDSNQSPKDMESVASLDSTGKKKSFRRLFARFGEKTSMTGVPYIYLAKLWWSKTIWSILLLGAVVVMSLHLWFLFDQWYSWPKNTRVELGFEPLDFPQVTICNTNIMHKTRFDNFKGADELKELVDILKPENLVSDQFDENYTYTTEATTTDTTTVDTQTTPGQNGGDTNLRRKRYIEEYEKINISNYYEDSQDNEDDYDYDFDDYYYDGDREQQTILREIVTEKYMEIDK